MSFHGSNRQQRNPGSAGISSDLRDLDHSGNEKIVDFVNSGDLEGRNAAVVLYSQSNNLPDHQSLRVGDPGHYASGRSFAAATYAGGGTGGFISGQPWNHQDPSRSAKGLVTRLGAKSKS